MEYNSLSPERRTLYEQLTTEYKQYTHCRIDLGEYAGPSLTQLLASDFWEWMTYKFHFEAPLSPA